MVPWRYKGVFVASHPYYIFFFLQGSPTILPLPVKTTFQISFRPGNRGQQKPPRGL